jgi:hypothetical protein
MLRAKVVPSPRADRGPGGQHFRDFPAPAWYVLYATGRRTCPAGQQRRKQKGDGIGLNENIRIGEDKNTALGCIGTGIKRIKLSDAIRGHHFYQRMAERRVLKERGPSLQYDYYLGLDSKILGSLHQTGQRIRKNRFFVTRRY